MRKQAGLSLIELMIAITLGLVLMTGVMQVFISSRVTFATQQAMSRIQETGRLAVEFISRDVRMAGYMGCASRSGAFGDTAGDVLNFHKDFEIGLQGFASVPAGVTLSPEPIANTDILVIRTADALPLLASGSNEANSVSVTVTDSAISNDCSNGICANQVVAASDCVDTRVFVANNLTAVNGTTLKVGGAVMPADNFTTGAELIPVKTYTYFVAPSTANANRPSLWQNVNGAAQSQELLEGVERLRLTYGRNGSTNYVTAASVTDWSNVNSVRIELLVASIDDRVLSEPQDFTFGGVASTAADLRLRQVFTNTIAMRSNLQ